MKSADCCRTINVINITERALENGYKNGAGMWPSGQTHASHGGGLGSIPSTQNKRLKWQKLGSCFWVILGSAWGLVMIGPRIKSESPNNCWK